jgi:malonyl-CoA/methylmalonyl-CoA synthetase
MPLPTVFDRAERFRARIALIGPDRKPWTYHELLERSRALTSVLLDGRRDLAESRIAFLTNPGSDYVIAQWAAWQAGGIAVPLAVMHPEPELEFVIRDCDASVIVADSAFASRASPLARRLGRRFIQIPLDGGTPRTHDDCDVATDRRAMIVYTSGSTGKPKGVVTTHANIEAQIETLTAAWEWTAEDRILLTLPLHHVHGIINVLGCALWSGATCTVLERFDPERVWQSFENDALTLFMAVPTIYRRLIEHWKSISSGQRQHIKTSFPEFRLMVSGSAALPEQTLSEWKEITGHTLLERYGMTEIGMALSNPLHGERVPGHVGLPLPGIEIKLVGEDGGPAPTHTPGEIYARGPGVFREYWNRPDETHAAFEGEWFKTGDVAILHDSGYRILGRQSVDIVKSGGYKVSALEVEEVLRFHPAVSECAVVGIPDAEWGERLAVAIEASDEISIEMLRNWAQARLAPYKIPSVLKTVGHLPRNALGKVVKPEVTALFLDEVP